MTVRYFSARNWSALGLNLEQVEYLRNIDTQTDFHTSELIRLETELTEYAKHIAEDMSMLLGGQ